MVFNLTKYLLTGSHASSKVPESRGCVVGESTVSNLSGYGASGPVEQEYTRARWSRRDRNRGSGGDGAPRLCEQAGTIMHMRDDGELNQEGKSGIINLLHY